MFLEERSPPLGMNTTTLTMGNAPPPSSPRPPPSLFRTIALAPPSQSPRTRRAVHGTSTRNRGTDRGTAARPESPSNAHPLWTKKNMPRFLQALRSLVEGSLPATRALPSEAAPPSSACSGYKLRELASSLRAYVPALHLGDASPSERLFLLAVLVIVVLFVVVLPAYEALRGEEEGGEEDARRSPPDALHQPDRVRVYRPDAGVVSVASDALFAQLSRASSSGSSCSGSLETIEESEEEGAEDMDGWPDTPRPR